MQFLLKHKWTIIFAILSLLSLAFLIFQSGIWTYLDNSYQFRIFLDLQNFDINKIYYRLSDITWSNYSGNYRQLTAWRYLNNAIELLLKLIRWAKWGAIIMYFIFFCVNYFVSKKIFSIAISSQFAWLWALLYTFNPLSIYMLNMGAFLYAYSAVPLMILWFYYCFYWSKYSIGLLLLSIGSIFLTSYTRFTLIYPLFLLFWVMIYYKDVRKLLIEKTKKCFIAVVILLLVNLPFITTIFYPIYSGEKDYFSGVGNYASSFKSWWPFAYDNIKKTTLPNLLVPTEPMWNIWYLLTNNALWIYFSLMYFAGCLYVLFLRQYRLSSYDKKLFALASISITIGLISRILPYYVSQDIFVRISYDILPFLANDSWFSHWFTIAGISVVIVLAMKNIKNIPKNLILLWTIIYCLWSISVLFLMPLNHKLRTVDISKTPAIENILEENYNKSIVWFVYPTAWVLMNWTPYPVPNAVSFVHGMDNDVRITPTKQTQLSSYFSKIDGNNPAFSNFSIFDISSFLVMQNIRKVPEHISFDRYDGNADYINQAAAIDMYFSQNTGLTLVETNALYKQYDMYNVTDYSFSFYLPLSIVFISWHESIFNTGINLSERPLFIDDSSYNKPSYINGDYVLTNTNTQTIDIKLREKQKWSYYLKIWWLSSWQDILLHFNKSFGVWWKVKYLDEKKYNNIPCSRDTYYPISDNTECIIENNFSLLQEFLYTLSSDKYENIEHFEGNIISNTRLINDINPNNNGDIYLLVSHDKQYLFTLTQTIAILLLFCMTLYSGFILLKSNDTD